MEIKYNFVDIKINQFAFFPDKFVGDDKMELKVDLEISSHIDLNKDSSILKYKVRVEVCQKENVFMLIESECFFSLTLDSWEKTEDSKFKLPLSFMRHLALLSIGAIRGIIYSKTEDIKSKGLVLQSIDISKLVNSDYIIES